MPASKLDTNPYIRISTFKKGDEFDSLKEKRRHESEFYQHVYDAWLKGQLPEDFDPDKKIIGQVVEYSRKSDGAFVSAIYPHEDYMLEAQKMMAGRGNHIECDKIFPAAYAESQRIVDDGSLLPGCFQIDMNDSLAIALANAGQFDKIFEIAKKTGKIDPEVLHAAVRLDNIDAATRLIDEFHVNVEHENNHGKRTALHLVKSIKMFDALVARKANVLHIDNFGDNVTHYYGGESMAHRSGNERPEKGLLEHAKRYIEKTHGADALEKARTSRPAPADPFAALFESISLDEPKAHLKRGFDDAKAAQTELYRVIDQFTSAAVSKLVTIGMLDRAVGDQITQAAEANLKIDFFGEYVEPKTLPEVMAAAQTLNQKSTAFSSHSKIVVTRLQNALGALSALIDRRDIVNLLQDFASPIGPQRADGQPWADSLGDRTGRRLG